MMLPFGLLLAAIALGPLLFAQWWSRNYGKTVFALGAVTVGFYLLFLPSSAALTVAHTAHDYMGFIALVGSLYVVSGGIHISANDGATPLTNVLFLLVGALLANLLGIRRYCKRPLAGSQRIRRYAAGTKVVPLHSAWLKTP